MQWLCKQYLFHVEFQDQTVKIQNTQTGENFSIALEEQIQQCYATAHGLFIQLVPSLKIYLLTHPWITPKLIDKKEQIIIAQENWIVCYATGKFLFYQQPNWKCIFEFPLSVSNLKDSTIIFSIDLDKKSTVIFLHVQPICYIFKEFQLYSQLDSIQSISLQSIDLFTKQTILLETSSHHAPTNYLCYMGIYCMAQSKYYFNYLFDQLQNECVKDCWNIIYHSILVNSSSKTLEKYLQDLSHLFFDYILLLQNSSYKTNSWNVLCQLFNLLTTTDSSVSSSLVHTQKESIKEVLNFVAEGLHLLGENYLLHNQKKYFCSMLTQDLLIPLCNSLHWNNYVEYYSNFSSQQLSTTNRNFATLSIFQWIWNCLEWNTIAPFPTLFQCTETFLTKFVTRLYQLLVLQTVQNTPSLQMNEFIEEEEQTVLLECWNRLHPCQRVVLALIKENMTNMDQLELILPTCVSVMIKECLLYCQNCLTEHNLQAMQLILKGKVSQYFEFIRRMDLYVLHTKQSHRVSCHEIDTSQVNMFEKSTEEHLNLKRATKLLQTSNPYSLEMSFLSNLLLQENTQQSSTQSSQQQTISETMMEQLFNSTTVTVPDAFKIVYQHALQHILSVPIGRGMIDLDSQTMSDSKLSLGNSSKAPLLFSIPPLCLSAVYSTTNQKKKLPPLELNKLFAHIDPNVLINHPFCWSEFHNAVSATLSLQRDSGFQNSISRDWILYHCKMNPPYSNIKLTHTQAGFLFALGLQNHLKQLNRTDVYAFLRVKHEPTTCAMLLGMSCSLIGSEDAQFTRTLSLHIPSLVVGASNVSGSGMVQSCAMLGMGFLYFDSKNRFMTEVLLNELARAPILDYSQEENGISSSTANSAYHSATQTALSAMNTKWGMCGISLVHVGTHKDREAYALSAGFALGLIHIGCGNQTNFQSSNSSKWLEERLLVYLNGGKRPASDPLFDEIEKSHTFIGSSMHEFKRQDHYQQFLATKDNILQSNAVVAGRLHEPMEMVNTCITAEGACIALILIYLKTNNKSTASKLQIDSKYTLDSLPNNHVLFLRVLGVALIFWDRIECTKEWVTNNVPTVLEQLLEQTKNYEVTIKKKIMINEEMQYLHQHYLEMHWICIAALCMAIGLRYCGTFSQEALQTLDHFFKQFHMDHHNNNKSKIQPSQFTADFCATVCLQSMCCIMAGTGNPKLCHYITDWYNKIHYGTYARQIGGVSDNSYGLRMALSMSVGLLYLAQGKMTLLSDNKSIACLLMSLYPKYPQNPLDNHYHLQMLRHMYVLATSGDSCLLFCKDDSQKKSTVEQTKLAVQMEFSNQPPREAVTPCLLPNPFSTNLTKLKVDNTEEAQMTHLLLTNTLDIPIYQPKPVAEKKKIDSLPLYYPITLQESQLFPASNSLDPFKPYRLSKTHSNGPIVIQVMQQQSVSQNNAKLQQDKHKVMSLVMKQPMHVKLLVAFYRYLLEQVKMPSCLGFTWNEIQYLNSMPVERMDDLMHQQH